MTPLYRARTARLNLSARSNRLILLLATVAAFVCTDFAHADAKRRAYVAAPMEQLEGNGEGSNPHYCKPYGYGRRPSVDAGGDQTVVAGEPVLFDGEAISAHGNERGEPSYEAAYWDFGDGYRATGIDTSHTYTDPGTYLATLTVVFNYCYSASAAVRVEVVEPQQEEPPPALEARFVLKKQVRDPETGNVDWQPFTVSEEEPIELGLKVMFDGCDSPGATYFWYQFMDGGSSMACNPIRAFDEGGTYDVRLTVYGAAGNSQTTTMTVPVRGGMELLDVMPPPPVSFWPFDAVIDRAGHLWAISGEGGIGYARITDPLNLPRLTIAPLPPYEYLSSVGSSGSTGYVAGGPNGAFVLRAATSEAGGSQISVIDQFEPTDLGGDWVMDVCGTSEGAYFLVWPRKLVYVSDSEAGSQVGPHLELPYDALRMVCLGGDAILAYPTQTNPSPLVLIDIRTPGAAFVQEISSQPITFSGISTVHNRMFALGGSAGQLIGNLVGGKSPTDPIRLGNLAVARAQERYWALSDHFLYSNSGFSGLYVGKWDIVRRPEDTTLVEFIDPTTYIIGAAPILFVELDGPQGQTVNTVVIGNRQNAFATISP